MSKNDKKCLKDIIKDTTIVCKGHVLYKLWINKDKIALKDNGIKDTHNGHIKDIVIIKDITDVLYSNVL